MSCSHILFLSSLITPFVHQESFFAPEQNANTGLIIWKDRQIFQRLLQTLNPTSQQEPQVFEVYRGQMLNVTIVCTVIDSST